MARMFAGAVRGDLDHYGVPALKQALGRLSEHPGIDAERVGAIGFCLGGSIVLTWGCIDSRLTAIAPCYGAAPKLQAAVRRLRPVVGSWPTEDFPSLLDSVTLTVSDRIHGRPAVDPRRARRPGGRGTRRQLLRCPFGQGP
jgi:dienelactone hydrolase